jgi:hypothetical protein
MEELRSRGVTFEEYDFGAMGSTENGLMVIGEGEGCVVQGQPGERSRAASGWLAKGRNLPRLRSYQHSER